MIRKLINNYINKEISLDDEIALLFSGGMDSLSILLSCLDVGIKPTLYTFYLDNYVSEDILSSRRIADLFDLKLEEIIIDTARIDLLADVRYIIKTFNTSKKTAIQCIHPFLYVIPRIKEECVLSGLCADELYGTPRSMAKYHKDIDFFKKIREDKNKDLYSSSYKYIKDLMCKNNKIFLAPFKTDKDIVSYMLSLNYKELHSPKQKNIVYEDYKDYIERYKLYRRNNNLQCCSKIREWHDILLTNKEVNTNNFKSVVGVYNSIYKGVKNI